jgi:hypothetical protein
VKREGLREAQALNNNALVDDLNVIEPARLCLKVIKRFTAVRLDERKGPQAVLGGVKRGCNVHSPPEAADAFHDSEVGFEPKQI